MIELARYDRQNLLNLLSERCAFERMAIRLYDAVLVRVDEAKWREPELRRLIPKLKKHRDQEVEHAMWTEGLIRNLGGTVHATDMTVLVQREAQGIEHVILGDKDLAHVFHALLAAELMDNAGWELLIELAIRADDRAALPELGRRFAEEQAHLELVQQVVSSFARSALLPRPRTRSPALRSG